VDFSTKEFAMSAITLPEPIAAYLAADTQGPDEVAPCFTAQGVVKDEGRTHIGREAIKAWKAKSSTLYTYTTEPFSAELIDGVHVVRCHVAGSFPGSPIDLTFRFNLERGLIASLEISV
jgi:hypothetical protein